LSIAFTYLKLNASFLGGQLLLSALFLVPQQVFVLAICGLPLVASAGQQTGAMYCASAS
jgi:hypothetical protein